MNLLSKLFGRSRRFLPLFKKLGPELAKRYGSSKGNYQGQIDRAIKETGIKKELIPYAYIRFLRDEDYEILIADSPDEWREKERELEAFIESRPRALGTADFYESSIGDSYTP